MHSVSVIVPVRNEATSIRQTLLSLLTQLYDEPFEIIVADGCSDDETVSIVRDLQAEYDQLKLVYNPARYSSAARNTALRHARYEYTVIIDGHCHIPDRHYLTNLVVAFEQSGADCLGRPQPLDTPRATVFQTAVAIARSSRLGHNPDSDIFSNEAKFVDPHNTAVAYRRSVYDAVGMFDERFDACEDVEFNHRVDEAGKTCYFTPTVKIIYHPRRTWLALFKQLSRYGCGRARLAFKHPKSLTLPALIPPLWLLTLTIGIAFMAIVPEFSVVYLAMLTVYCGVVLSISAYLGRGQAWPVRWRIPLVFLGIHLGFAWGFLGEIARQCRLSLDKI